MSDAAQGITIASGSLSTLLCIAVLTLYRRLLQLHEFNRPVKITTNLKIYMILMIVDFFWGIKYVLQSLFYFASDMSAENRCKLFGFFETFYTLLQCFVVILFWAHVACALYGWLQEGGDDSADLWFGVKDHLVVKWYTLIAAVIAVGAAAAAEFGLITADSGELWCWVHVEDPNAFDWAPIVYSYLWDALGTVIFTVGMILPLCRHGGGKHDGGGTVWSGHTKRAMQRRAIAGVAHVVITLISVVLRYSACDSTAFLTLFAAAVMPLNGAVDALAFLLSEPGLASALIWGGMMEDKGFTVCLEELKTAAQFSMYASM